MIKKDNRHFLDEIDTVTRSRRAAESGADADPDGENRRGRWG